MKELVNNHYPESPISSSPSRLLSPSSAGSWEEVLVKIPGAIVHLIDKDQSIELAVGDFAIVRLWQGENVVAILARVDDDAIQWPLAKDEAAVKLDDSHYFFTLRIPSLNRAYAGTDDDDGGEIVVEHDKGEEFLNYGLTIVSRGGQEESIKKLDGVLEYYSNFSVQRVNQVVGGSSSSEEERSAAYWTILAPNVEDYSGSVARMIAAGSVQLIKGILWCGEVTVDRLIWGNGFLKERLGPGSTSEISPEAFKRIERYET